MNELKWISSDEDPTALPPAHDALAHPNGLVAAGGRLSTDWLISAYKRGIFPWYEEGQPVLWWSPDPRSVLWTDELRISRSLRRAIRRRAFEITSDVAFEAVIHACAEPRQYTSSTWITTQMATAYIRLHEAGWAHSFEAWQGDRLVGGLYGVAIGRVFFGESMFSRATDSSKVAFAAATRFLASRNMPIIDCQIPSAHLTSLGAIEMPREKFVGILRKLCRPTRAEGSWRQEFATLFAQRCSARQSS